MQGVSNKDIRSHDRNNYILNIMNLKLAETTRAQEKTGPLYQQNTPLKSLVINTPSTNATQKKFHSCELQRHNPNPNI